VHKNANQNLLSARPVAPASRKVTISGSRVSDLEGLLKQSEHFNGYS